MRRIFPFLIACAACHPAPALLTLPDPGSAKTAAYIATGEGREPMIYISDLARAPGLPDIARREGESVELSIIYYACPPNILRLTPGLAPIVEEGHPLPGGTAAYRAVLNDDGPSPWSKVPHPPAVASLKIEREIACAKFDLVTIDLAGTGDTFGVFAIPVGDEEVLVSLPGRGFFRVTPFSYEEVPEMRDLPGAAYFKEREDRVWLFGSGNTLAVGDPRTGVFERKERFQDMRGPSLRAWMTGSNEGEAFELFTFHDRNVIARFDGETWTKLYQGPYRPQDFALFGGIAWFGPGDAIAVWDHYENPLRVTTSTVMVETALPTASRDRHTVIKNIPGLGPISGTQAGRAYVRGEDGRWTNYPDAPIGGLFGGFFPDMSAMAPLDDGVLIGGGDGSFTQLQPRLARRDKYCHYDKESEAPVEGLVVTNQFATAVVSDLQPLGCGYVFVSRKGIDIADPEDHDPGDDVEIGFLKRK